MSVPIAAAVLCRGFHATQPRPRPHVQTGRPQAGDGCSATCVCVRACMRCASCKREGERNAQGRPRSSSSSTRHATDPRPAGALTQPPTQAWSMVASAALRRVSPAGIAFCMRCSLHALRKERSARSTISREQHPPGHASSGRKLARPGQGTGGFVRATPSSEAWRAREREAGDTGRQRRITTRPRKAVRWRPASSRVPLSGLVPPRTGAGAAAWPGRRPARDRGAGRWRGRGGKRALCVPRTGRSNGTPGLGPGLVWTERAQPSDAAEARGGEGAVELAGGLCGEGRCAFSRAVWPGQGGAADRGAAACWPAHKC